MELAISFGVGLASGLFVGWIGHRLAKKRSKEDARRAEMLRAINDTIELVEAFSDYRIHLEWSSGDYREAAAARYETAKRSSYADVDLIPDSEAWALLGEFVEAPIPTGPASEWIAHLNEYRNRAVRSLKERRAGLTM